MSAWHRRDAITEQEIARVLDLLVAEALMEPDLQVVLFLTNSRRVATQVPRRPELRCAFRHRARKPWTWHLPALARGGHGWAVCGDQLLTDGLLAWRLRAPFVHLVQPEYEAPWWPRVQARADQCIIRLFFRANAGRAGS